MRNSSVHTRFLPFASVAASFFATAYFSDAGAQEGALGPPEALQYPVEANQAAPNGATGPFLRAAIEAGADVGLCQALMTQAGRTIPPDFDAGDCEPEFTERVKNGEGFVHWADDARPLKCGSSCFGRPFMTQTQSVGRPNLRQAMLYGSLNFKIDAAGVNRDLSYFYEMRFTCKTENGARQGDFIVDIDFGDPVLGGAGALESVVDFFLLPAQISRRIESFIRSNLEPAPGQTFSLNPCLSVGVSRADNPFFDAAVYDRPARSGVGVRPVLAATALDESATVEFLRITRKPLPATVPSGHATPGDPAAGYFTVHLNGAAARFPGAEGLVLPPEGGAAPINFCKTVGLGGWDRLQIVIANGLGGAAWSQFGRLENFGAGEPRTMTTGRTVVVPGLPGPPDPLTGRPTQTKPQAVVLQEFEILYRITYSEPPELVATSPTGAGRPGHGESVAGPLGDRAVVADPDRPAAEPCRRI